MRLSLIALIFFAWSAMAQLPTWPDDPAFSLPQRQTATCNTTPAVSQDGTTTVGLGNNSTAVWVGQTNLTTAGSICSVEVKMSKSAGSITSKSFTVQVFSMSGANLGTLLRTSTAVTGSDSWSGTWVTFDFPTTADVTTDPYAVVVTTGSSDASNYAVLFSNASGTIAGSYARFNSSKVAQGGSSADIGMRIHFTTQ